MSWYLFVDWQQTLTKNAQNLNFATEMGYHDDQLVKHCRVCGKQLCKARSRTTSYWCSDHKEALEHCFGIDLTKDNPSIHPKKFCNPCYAVAKHSAAASTKGIPYHHSVVLMDWVPHQISGCKVYVTLQNRIQMLFRF